MSLIHNERIKLKANYLNGLAIGVFLVGGLSQITSALSVGSGKNGTAFWITTGVACVCILASPVLHLWARHALKDLEL